MWAILTPDDGTGSRLGHYGRMVTLGFLHAHPDDEALLTAGTMARAAAEGHRVVLITATDGAEGLAAASFGSDLAQTRERELQESARILGVSAIHPLGFHDSGLHGDAPGGFASQPVGDLAERVRQIMDAEGIDVLIGYDPSGGYGHPDHIQVHHVARAASVMGGTRLFEATLPREPISRAVRLAARMRVTPEDFDPAEFAHAYTPRADITHRVDVRAFLGEKRASMKAHASQASADDSTRTLAVLSGLPGPVFTALLGTEYYVRVP